MNLWTFAESRCFFSQLLDFTMLFPHWCVIRILVGNILQQSHTIRYQSPVWRAAYICSSFALLQQEEHGNIGYACCVCGLRCVWLAVLYQSTYLHQLVDESLPLITLIAMHDHRHRQLPYVRAQLARDAMEYQVSYSLIFLTCNLQYTVTSQLTNSSVALNPL